jgi:hypothetical protein
MRGVQIECKEEYKRRDARQDSNFDAGGVRFEVRDEFPGIRIGGTRDVFLARRQLCPAGCNFGTRHMLEQRGRRN